MKRNQILMGLLTVALLCSSALPVNTVFASVPETAPTVSINGEVQKFTPAPVTKESRVYLPMRALFEALGATVSWDAKTETVTAVKEEIIISLPLNQPYAYINGVITKLDTPAYEENGRTMVPLRFVGESLGLPVVWDGAQNLVEVQTISTTNGAITGKEDTTLSYEKAATKVVRNNKSYYDLQTSLSKTEDANERVYISLGSYNASLIQQKDKLNLQEKWLEQQLGLVAQGLSVNTRSQMDQISMLAEKLELLEATRKYQDYALEIAQLKYDHGMISKVELETLQSKVNQTTVSLELCKANIEAGYLALNAALDADAKERLDLEYTFSYVPVTEEELVEKLRTCTQEDPYLWYARQNADLADYRLKTYDYMTDYYGGGLSYPVAAMDLASAKQNVKTIEKSLQDQIQTRYNKLRQLELTISQKEMALADAVRTEHLMNIRFNAGMVIKAELMEAQLAVPAAIQELRELQMQHAQLRITFDQPYLQPDYTGSSS